MSKTDKNKTPTRGKIEDGTVAIPSHIELLAAGFAGVVLEEVPDAEAMFFPAGINGEVVFVCRTAVSAGKVMRALGFDIKMAEVALANGSLADTPPRKQ